MAIRIVMCLVVALGCACAAPASNGDTVKAIAPEDIQDNSDLKADASVTYGRRYPDWGGYPGNSYITGYGILDDKYSGHNGGYNAYDGDNGVRGYGGYSGYNGYANPGYGGYKGYSGYDSSGLGGYGSNAYGTSGGYGSSGYGGYGGYGGNGGLNSYYGYNNPSYQGAGHLGYGYGYRKPGYGNIYSSGITPSLVTGYRGYSRR